MDSLFFQSGLLSVLLENNTIEEFPENVKDLVKKLQKIDNSKYISEIKENLAEFSERDRNFLNNTFLDHLYTSFTYIPPWEGAAEHNYVDVMEYIEEKTGKITDKDTIEFILVTAAKKGNLDIIVYFTDKLSENENIIHTVLVHAEKNKHLHILKHFKKYIYERFFYPVNFWNVEFFKFYIEIGVVNISHQLYRILLEYDDEIFNFSCEYCLENKINFNQVHFGTVVWNKNLENRVYTLVEKNLLTEDSIQFNQAIFLSVAGMSIEFLEFYIEKRGGHFFPFHMCCRAFDWNTNINIAKYLIKTYSNTLNLKITPLVFEIVYIPSILLNFDEDEYHIEYAKTYFSLPSRIEYKSIIDKSHYSFMAFTSRQFDLLEYAVSVYFPKFSQKEKEKAIQMMPIKQHRKFFREKMKNTN